MIAFGQSPSGDQEDDVVPPWWCTTPYRSLDVLVINKEISKSLEWPFWACGLAGQNPKIEPLDYYLLGEREEQSLQRWNGYRKRTAWTKDIRNDPGILAKACQNWMRRWIEVGFSSSYMQFGNEDFPILWRYWMRINVGSLLVCCLLCIFGKKNFL